MSFYTNNNSNLSNAIFQAIAFFGLFDYPLTILEVYANCRNTKSCVPTVADIIGELDNSQILKKKIGQKNGFYFLAGREEIVDERLRRFNYSDQKFKRALRMAKIFRLVPYVELIAMANLLGRHNLRKGSDIDLFVAVKKNRIWTARLFLVAFIKLFRLRPRPENIQDKICLSFFITDENLDLSRFMLDECKMQNAKCKNLETDFLIDVYFIYWFSGLYPFFDRGNIFSRLTKENQWIKKYLALLRPIKPVKIRQVKARPASRLYYFLFDLCFGKQENFWKKLQLKKLPAEYKEIVNKDTRVVINDSVIKMHLNDRREEYREKFIKEIIG